MSKPNNELYDILLFYENKIRPYKYTYKCEFGTTISFTIEPDEVCHLFFGSLKNKNVPNAKLFKGQAGYDAILNGTVTKVPYQLVNDFKSKSLAFYKLPELLNEPIAIYYNENIVQKGNIRGFYSDINGDFLLYKEIDNKNIHFFLKHFPNKNDRLIPYSTFHNKKNDYIVNQKIIKVLDMSIRNR